MQYRTIAWKNDQLILLDQNSLPKRERYVTARSCSDVARAIRDMTLRGAPLIGVAAAYGLYLASTEISDKSNETYFRELERASEMLLAARPTAVNLGWALRRMMQRAGEAGPDPHKIRAALLDEAVRIHQEDVETNRRIGEHMLTLMHDGMDVLTHCNAGALATAGYGTALSGVYLAAEKGWDIHVWADETRPRLQGARLTACELSHAGIRVTLITDSMAAVIMSQGRVDAVMVGCDRMAANGDAANKIGTYGLSIAAKYHGVPFYAALPVSTIDFSLEDGKSIPIEERNGREITHTEGRCTAPKDVSTYNPAFDVTPHGNITAIVTEQGIIHPPFDKGLAGLKR